VRNQDFAGDRGMQLRRRALKGDNAILREEGERA